MHTWTVLLVALVLLALTSGVARAQSGWMLGPEMPTPRAEMATAVLGGKIYVIGGRGPQDKVRAEVEVYDAATDRWQTAEKLEEARTHAAAAVLNGRIYVLGGRDADEKVLDEVEVYDPAEDEWRSVSHMKEKREGHSAVVLGGRLFVLGGSDDKGNFLSSVEYYDPDEDKWRMWEQWLLDVPGNPPGRAAFATAVVGEALFTFGGFSLAGGPLEAVQQFQVGQEAVSVMPPASFHRRASLAALVLGDSIYLIGGKGLLEGRRPEVFDDALVFTPGSSGNGVDRWQELPDRLNTGRYGFAAGAVNGRLYVIGGRDEDGEVLSSVETYGPMQSTSTANEQAVQPPGFNLSQNHPNPFTGQTVISFEIPADGNGATILRVADVHGRVVATLVDAYLPPGRHTVRWNGITQDGQRVASGVYFYYLEQEQHRVVKMMSLIR